MRIPHSVPTVQFKHNGVASFYTSTHPCFNHRASVCHAVIVKDPAIIFVRFYDFGIMTFQHTCLSELLNRTSDSWQVTKQILWSNTVLKLTQESKLKLLSINRESQNAFPYCKQQLLDNCYFNKVFDQNLEGTRYVKIKTRWQYFTWLSLE
jgi:hypothetical protein